MTVLSAAEIAQFHREGFLLIPGVFTPAEITGLQRAAALQRAEGAFTSPIFGIPGQEHLWRDERLTKIATQLLGDGAAFFGQADYVRYIFAGDEHISGRHAHHDAKGSADHLFNRTHTARGTTYPVVRFGVYFQDCAEASGGLKVSPGSHLIDTSSFNEADLPYANVASRPGDLVCFCARVIHSPFALRRKDQPDAVLSPHQEDDAFAAAPDSFLPSPSLRETIFIDYAAPSVEADLLIKNRAVLIPLDRASLVDVVRAQALEHWAQVRGLGLRLDFAAVETAHAIGRAISSGTPPTACGPLLQSLRDLALLSREWSPHHTLFGDIPDGAGHDVLYPFWKRLLRRIKELRDTGATRHKDVHMGARILGAPPPGMM